MGILDEFLRLEPPDPKDVAYEKTFRPALRRRVLQGFEGTATDADEHAKALSLLTFGLFDIYFGQRPEKRLSERERHCKALFYVAHYLLEQKVPGPLITEILDLGNALQDLDIGIVRPCFDPKIGTGRTARRPLDPSNIWDCRAGVAAGLDFLMRERMPKKTGLAHIDKNFGVLAAVLASPGRSFPGAIDNWRRKFLESKAPHKSAQTAFDGSWELYSRYRQDGFKGREIADKLLVDVMMQATRVSDQAMKRLYPEIERRARLKRPY